MKGDRKFSAVGWWSGFNLGFWLILLIRFIPDDIFTWLFIEMIVIWIFGIAMIEVFVK